MKLSQRSGARNIDHAIVWGHVSFLYGSPPPPASQDESCCNVVWEPALNIENNARESDSEECFVFRLTRLPCLHIDMGFFFTCLMFAYTDKKSSFYEIRLFYHIIELLNLVVFFLNIWIICFAFVFIATYKISKSSNRSYIHTVRFIYVC